MEDFHNVGHILYSLRTKSFVDFVVFEAPTNIFTIENFVHLVICSYVAAALACTRMLLASS